jgi:allophanate hydrolase
LPLPAPSTRASPLASTCRWPGVPYAAKDNIDVAGLPPPPPARPSPIARAFRHGDRTAEAAGAICVGKTNLDQFATGLVGTRSPYGIPRNAYNRAYVSGGSSSGSAVASAAGLVPFALGTDTAGSGRVPAAFNHLVGFKPTKGRWSTRGLVPACRTLDCITVFTDAWPMPRWSTRLAGFDAEDAFSRPLADVPLSAKRIGVPRRDQRVFFGDVQAEYLYDRALGVLAAQATSWSRSTSRRCWKPRSCSMAGRGWPNALPRSRNARSNPAAIDPVVRACRSRAGDERGRPVERHLPPRRLKRACRGAVGAGRCARLPDHRHDLSRGRTAGRAVALNSNLGRYTNFVNLLDMAAIGRPGRRRGPTTRASGSP